MKEQDENLIMAMAKFMGVELEKRHYADTSFFIKDGKFLPYNPLTNGTQREEFYEESKIGIRHLIASNTWSARVFLGKCTIDKSRTKAGLLCAAAFLNVEWIG